MHLRMSERVSEKASWELSEGEEIAQGRSVLELLGGGNRYEAYLVWDEHLLSPMVAKVIRPDQVENEAALRGLRREAEALDSLAHPVILRGSTRCSTRLIRMCWWSRWTDRHCGAWSGGEGRWRWSRHCRWPGIWPPHSTTWPPRAGSTST